jgi:hypothetical protein
MLLQVFPPNPCIASANTPLSLVEAGLLNYTNVVKVPADKLILVGASNAVVTALPPALDACVPSGR